VACDGVRASLCAVCRLNTASESHSFSMKIDFSSSFFSPLLRLPFSAFPPKPGMKIHNDATRSEKRRELVQERERTKAEKHRERGESHESSLSNTFRDLLFRMFYVLVDIFRFSVVSFHLPRNLYIDPKVFYYTTENQFSLQCVLV
jgi:hypothetical protein